MNVSTNPKSIFKCPDCGEEAVIQRKPDPEDLMTDIFVFACNYELKVPYTFWQNGVKCKCGHDMERNNKKNIWRCFRCDGDPKKVAEIDGVADKIIKLFDEAPPESED